MESKSQGFTIFVKTQIQDKMTLSDLAAGCVLGGLKKKDDYDGCSGTD